MDRLTAMGMFTPNQSPKDIEKRFDIEALQHELETVMLDKAYPKKAKKGPYRERADLKTIFGTIYPLQFRALQEREGILALPDTLWEWARTINLRALLLYQREQPFMATDQRMGKKAPRATVTNLCEPACDSLLSFLGMAYLQEGPTPDWPGLDHRIWQKGEVTSTINVDIITASLLLPDGNPLPYLRNEVIISFREEQRRQFIVDFLLF